MQTPQVYRAALTILALGAIAACANRTAGGEAQDTEIGQSAASVVGEWILMPASPTGRPGPGLQLDVRIDSVRASRVFGGLTRFFSGNVGLDATRFSRFSGTLSEDTLIAFAISTEEDPPAALSISGIVRPDTITVTQFVLGPDTLSGGRRAWVLLRTERR